MSDNPFRLQMNDGCFGQHGGCLLSMPTGYDVLKTVYSGLKTVYNGFYVNGLRWPLGGLQWLLDR